MTTTSIHLRRLASLLPLAALVAAFAVPAATATPRPGSESDVIDRYLVSHRASTLDGRSPDTLDAARSAHPVQLVRPGAVDPLAAGALGALGMSSAQIESWTHGACSYADKPAGCYLTPVEARAASNSLGRVFLSGTGLSSSQVESWVDGVCSYRDKPSSCYLSESEARRASQHEAASLGAPTTTPPPAETVLPRSFDWTDALIGAAVAACVFLLGAAGAFVLRRRREPAHR